MARTIVETLSQGVDPLTGYPLPKSDLCSNKEIQDALNTVLANCTIESAESISHRHFESDGTGIINSFNNS